MHLALRETFENMSFSILKIYVIFQICKFNDYLTLKNKKTCEKTARRVLYNVASSFILNNNPNNENFVAYRHFKLKVYA